MGDWVQGVSINAPHVRFRLQKSTNWHLSLRSTFHRNRNSVSKETVVAPRPHLAGHRQASGYGRSSVGRRQGGDHTSAQPRTGVGQALKSRCWRNPGTSADHPGGQPTAVRQRHPHSASTVTLRTLRPRGLPSMCILTLQKETRSPRTGDVGWEEGPCSPTTKGGKEDRRKVRAVGELQEGDTMEMGGNTL